MFLKRIVAHKREEIGIRRGRLALGELKAQAEAVPPARDFLRAIKRGSLQEDPREGLPQGSPVNLIAEIKKASPSRGVIRNDFRPEEIAKVYEAAGARAISVLTESRFFQGDSGYLGRVKAVTRLPLLRKDFIIDPCQIYESRVLGADAMLLVAAILEPSQLQDYLGLAGELGLAALVEVHTAAELARVLAAGAGIIGINNRDLQTFQTSLDVTFSLRPAIPAGKVVVSESGIRTPADIEALAASGVDAVLVGEALMRAEDIGAAVRLLLGRGNGEWAASEGENEARRSVPK